MFKKLFLVPAFTLLFTQPAWTAPVDTASSPANTAKAEAHDEKASNRLAEKLDSIHSLNAQFKQDAISADGRVVSESGQMQMKRPGLFRWVTEDPYQQEILAKEQKVWMIDHDLEQVIIQQQDQRMANTPAQLLSGNALELLSRYQVAFINTGSVERYTLTPVGESDLFEKLDLAFRQGTLESIEMRDSLGGRRRISFIEVTTNGSISNGRFKVTIPKHFDVIDESGS